MILERFQEFVNDYTITLKGESYIQKKNKPAKEIVREEIRDN